MSVVGFDFGTTNSLVSSIQGNRAINFLDDEGLPIPSVACYEGNKIIVGREAKLRLGESGLGIKGNVVKSPKILLGQDSVFVEGVERDPIDIVADVVRFVAKQAEDSSRSRRGDSLNKIERAVVTIPVDMDGRRRAALRDAFRLSGINIVQFVHEPLAALYGFFRNQNDISATLRSYDKKLILVFDWGGGTLDLTLCRLIDGMLVQIQNDGTYDVGGDMFDEMLAQEIERRVLQNMDDAEAAQILMDAKTRLIHRCERAKIDLSTRDKVQLYIPNFFRGSKNDELDYSLTRDEMEEIIAPLLDNGLNRITKLLESAHVSPAQISLCLATGGMANMPIIKARLHEWFGAQRVQVSDRSGTLIAEGAAWIAHDEAQLQIAKKVELLLARNSYMSLIEAGSIMPKEGETKADQFHLYCADPRDGYAKFQLSAPVRPGKNVLPNDDRNTLANLVVKVDSKARPFQERLELDVEIDENLILTAKARSLTKKYLATTEVHDLEFGLYFPTDYTKQGVLDDINYESKLKNHKQGSLIFRSNIVASNKHKIAIPGELLYQIEPHYFDYRLDPPSIQVEEKLYYQPCAICHRASNDPLCNCSSKL
ncbi:Hsp70 family protein [Methylomonas sp. YC3]